MGKPKERLEKYIDEKELKTGCRAGQPKEKRESKWIRRD